MLRYGAGGGGGVHRCETEGKVDGLDGRGFALDLDKLSPQVKTFVNFIHIV